MAYGAHRQKLQRDQVLADPKVHGKRATYVYWQCRCRPCRDAHNEYFRSRRRRAQGV